MSDTLKTQQERTALFESIVPKLQNCFPNKIEITSGVTGIFIQHPALTMYRLERIIEICKMHNLVFVVSTHKGEVQLSLTLNVL